MHTTQPKQFKVIADPGHAWLEVTESDLKELGLRPLDFSPYSYKSSKAYYLEEDCDMGIFMRAYEKKHGTQPKYAEHYAHQTFVRNLPSICQ